MNRVRPQTALMIPLLGMALCVLAASGCGGGDEERIPEVGPITQSWLEKTQTQPGNILLLTLDTTRADRIGCYGYDLVTTPYLDQLATEGVTFLHAISPVPITLPSHASILTGLNPNEHGIRNNGTFVLGEEYVTVTEVLASHGFTTGATLGAFPVSAQFGLAQGFEDYDDDFTLAHRETAWGWEERPADIVTDKTLAWLEQHRDERFFHWAHYFDPHAPYEAPPEFRQKFSNPYDAEVAYMDDEVGRLLEGMEELGLRENTWIVIVGDHGESLWDHDEPTHSIFIYDATQRVPCLLIPPATYGGLSDDAVRGRVVEDVVALRDLAPTMLNAVGLSSDLLPATGSSLLPLLAGGWDGPGVTYMESLAPYLDHGWCELRGVRTNEWTYIKAPRAELYDLRTDPHQLNNIATEKPGVTARLAAWCDYFIETGTQDLAIQLPDDETLERLRSLGYVANPHQSGASINEKDPKDLTGVLRRISLAREALQTQRMEEARRQYEEALEIDPENTSVQRELGTVYQYLGDGEKALALFDKILNLYPEDWNTHLMRVQALSLTGAHEEAESALKVYLESAPDPEDGVDLYARLLAQTGRLEEARTYLEDHGRESGNRAQDLETLADLEWIAGNQERAYNLAGEVLALDSLRAGAWGLIGEWYALRANEAADAGNLEEADRLLEEARPRLERALSLDPSEPRAAFRMGWFAARNGDARRALQLYELALGRAPHQPETHFNMGNLLQRMNRPAEALAHYDQAVELGMEAVNLYVNRGVVLAMMQRREDAAAAWRHALTLGPDQATREGLERNLQRLGY